uniref:R13L1/DRL21-like LRR repeat region domain-containing protein n=1 Tax=Vitis vinifera TaxID=29760 RepID=F6HK64_VITVI
MHDLAQYISREFCIRVEDDKVQEISENTHHSLAFCRTFDRLVVFKRFEALAKIKGWREMPSHISTLKSLQKLSNFIVGQKGGSRIGELGELSDIGGRLEISEMQNVECARDALRANMKDKRHLDELSLAWRDEGTNDVIQSGVLNNLQPHPNLKQLTIAGYPGVAFPDWIGGGSSLSNLVTLLLWTCENCSSLPPLGQLPSLKHLSISGLKGVERVGREFYGDASSSIASKPSFPFLQTLRFDRMDNWEQWLCCGCEFHRLQELYIKKCPKLTGKLPEELPSLKKLEIDGCRGLLVASLQVPAIRELKMVGILTKVFAGVIISQRSKGRLTTESQRKSIRSQIARISGH